MDCNAHNGEANDMFEVLHLDCSNADLSHAVFVHFLLYIGLGYRNCVAYVYVWSTWTVISLKYPMLRQF